MCFNSIDFYSMDIDQLLKKRGEYKKECDKCEKGSTDKQYYIEQKREVERELIRRGLKYML